MEAEVETFSGELSSRLKIWLEERGFDFSSPWTAAGKAGSNRRYWRAPLGEGSVVLMTQPAVDADFGRFEEMTRYLLRKGVRVPELHVADEIAGQMLMEDLGSVSFYDVVRNEGSEEGLFNRYSAALALLAGMQERCADCETDGPALLVERKFGYKALRWETDYFSEHWLGGVMRIGRERRDALADEFDELALRVRRHPVGLMHRDFQSQNLMAVRTRPLSLAAIDYQGARVGSVWYDLASLLWDPYVGLDRQQVRYHWRLWCGLRKIDASSANWRAFVEASLQRLMQACGAFGNLGRRQGKPFFEAQIPAGRRQLETALGELPESEFPLLRETLAEGPEEE